MARERVVITVAGSDSDDPQLIEGLKILLQAKAEGKISIMDLKGLKEIEICQDGHLVISAHRHPKLLNQLLELVAILAATEHEKDFIIVCAAGMLAVLPSVAAGILYNELEVPNGNAFVIGVGLEYHPGEITDNTTISFDCFTAKQKNDQAARLSLTQAPGCLAICQDKDGVFFGEYGFTRACQLAIAGEIKDTLRNEIIEASKGSSKKPSCRPIAEIINQAEESA